MEVGVPIKMRRKCEESAGSWEEARRGTEGNWEGTGLG